MLSPYNYFLVFINTFNLASSILLGIKQASVSTSSTSAFRPYDTIKGIKNGSSSSLYDWKGTEGLAEETEPSDLTIASG